MAQSVSAEFPQAGGTPESNETPSNTSERSRSRLASIIGNTLSVLGSDIANRASSFALYALIARFLGDFAFGQTQLALTFFYVGWSLAGLGIKWYLTRELSDKPERTDSYLVNGSVLVVVTGLVILAALFGLVSISGYREDTALAILIMGVTIIPYTLMMVAEGVLMGREKMQFVFYVNGPINVANIVASFIALSMGASLLVIMLIQVVAYTLIILIEWYLMLRYVTRPKLKIDVEVIRSLFKGTRSFSGIDATIAVMGLVQPYIISLVATESDVGIYGAAGQISSPIMLVMVSVINSLLPILTRQVKEGYRILKISAEKLIEITFGTTLPAVTGVMLLAPQILIFLYERESFAEATIYLRIMIPILIIRAIIQVVGMMLYASGNESVNLRITVIMTVVSLIANVIAITLFQALGAAVVGLLLNVVDLALHYFFIWERMKIWVNPLPALWRPALASAAMAAAIILLPDDLHLLIQVAVGGLVYALAIGALLIITIGSPGKIREYFLRRPSDIAADEDAKLIPIAEGD
jgi:O-antigen/teichoic acid export membrane protein